MNAFVNAFVSAVANVFLHAFVNAFVNAFVSAAVNAVVSAFVSAFGSAFSFLPTSPDLTLWVWLGVPNTSYVLVKRRKATTVRFCRQGCGSRVRTDPPNNDKLRALASVGSQLLRGMPRQPSAQSRANAMHRPAWELAGFSRAFSGVMICRLMDIEPTEKDERKEAMDHDSQAAPVDCSHKETTHGGNMHAYWAQCCRCRQSIEYYSLKRISVRKAKDLHDALRVKYPPSVLEPNLPECLETISRLLEKHPEMKPCQKEKTCVPGTVARRCPDDSSEVLPTVSGHQKEASKSKTAMAVGGKIAWASLFCAGCVAMAAYSDLLSTRIF